MICGHGHDVMRSCWGQFEGSGVGSYRIGEMSGMVRGGWGLGEEVYDVRYT